MAAFWQTLFSSNFIPHGHCYLWKPGLVWLHIISDSLIAVAYYSIPLMLVYFVQQRRDLPFDWIFLLFGTFIIACGTTHVIEVWTLWHPHYWISGLVKALTASVSLYTAIMLVNLIPKALALPSPAELEITNRKLEMEISERLKAEEKNRFQARLLDVVEQAVIATDLNGIVSYWNQFAEKLYGWSAAETLGRDIVELIPSEFSQTQAAELMSRLSTGESWSGEFMVRHRNGRSFPVLATDSPIHDERGILCGVVGLSFDISDRKLAEERLRQSEERFRSYFELSFIGVAITSPEKGWIEVNDTFCELLGYSRNELNGTTWAQLTHPEDLEVDLNQYNRVLEGEIDAYSLEKRYIRSDGDIIYTNILVRCLRRSDRSVDYFVALLEDITDRVRANDALRQSEARYKELAQQEELINRLASQIRNSLDLDTILETAVQEIGKLLQIDRCLFIWLRFFPPVDGGDERIMWEIVKEAKHPDLESRIGVYPLQEQFRPLVEKLLNLEIIRADDVETVTDPILQQVLRFLGHTSMLDLPFKTQSGQIGIVNCSHTRGFRPWRDSEVELLQAVTDQLAIAINQAELYAQSQEATKIAQAQAEQIAQALQKLQQTQAQLIQSEKMSGLGQLVAGIAHEINNPVSFIHGNINYATGYIQDLLSLVKLYQQYYPKPVKEIEDKIEAIDLDFLLTDLPKLLSSMKVGTDRIRQIVLSLRNFSRLDEAEMKPVDIHEGIDNTLLILQHRFKENAARPSIKLDKNYGKLPLVECYPGQINQVFMNILSNAIDALEHLKFAGVERLNDCIPTICIRTEVANDSVQISIMDNGPGMTEEIRHKLFDPFFTTKPVGKGTGLGLSITYQIVVEKHAGKIECISAPGKGAEFVVQIPIRRQYDFNQRG
ncbi:PAS domain S-box protein [Planktothrix sp. FACHB-1355]|uniref:histidine kinase n=1 Tax=Aerosakkonema funiforme FACHB-1375 TaxID=2949571 RepID=A0A926VA51_9CYAN|nr:MULTISPECIES: PAS domain S-box protein [Oscillatoriales]MBD2180106.1 PAS domain S-box protein [Aerosakkonema funiforme FACHB-1375]MBD3558549.1 PAS domain S-box protein [Planktothrix sp. FACHB-1355]